MSVDYKVLVYGGKNVGKNLLCYHLSNLNLFFSCRDQLPSPKQFKSIDGMILMFSIHHRTSFDFLVDTIETPTLIPTILIGVRSHYDNNDQNVPNKEINNFLHKVTDYYCEVDMNHDPDKILSSCQKLVQKINQHKEQKHSSKKLCCILS